MNKHSAPTMRVCARRMFDRNPSDCCAAIGAYCCRGEPFCPRGGKQNYVRSKSYDTFVPEFENCLDASLFSARWKVNWRTPEVGTRVTRSSAKASIVGWKTRNWCPGLESELREFCFQR